LRNYYSYKPTNILELKIACHKNNHFIWYAIVDDKVFLIGNEKRILDSFPINEIKSSSFRLGNIYCDFTKPQNPQYAIYVYPHKATPFAIIITNNRIYNSPTDYVYSYSANQGRFKEPGPFIVIAKKQGRTFLEISSWEREKHYESEDMPTISPDGKRIAFRARKKYKYIAVIDGKESEEYDDIYNLSFSPDSKRFAFIARKENKSFAIVDGVKSKEYSVIFDPFFTADGKYIFLATESPNSPYKVVIDNKESEGYDDLPRFFFSQDKSKFLYLAVKKGRNVISDGVNSRTFDFIEDVTFAVDNKNFAYKALKNGKTIVVLNNSQESKEYDDVGNIIFSPDGKRIAFKARKNTKELVVVDNIEGKEYDFVDSLVFSPDSKKVAYRTKKDSQYYMVLDNLESKPYDYVHYPIFTGDSSKLLFIAMKEGDYFLVDNFQEHKRYYNISPYSLVVSQKGSRYGYIAVKENKKEVAVIDGKEEKEYDKVGYYTNIKFSPDGTKYAYDVQINNKKFIVLNGKESENYTLLYYTPAFTEDSLHFYWYGFKNADKVLIIDNVAYPIYSDSKQFKFSKDGKNFFIIARKFLKDVIIVDGIESDEYDEIIDADFLPTKSNAVVALARNGNAYKILLNNKEIEGYTTVSNFIFNNKKLIFLGWRFNKLYKISCALD
jgi:hypothetical protein